MTKTVEAYLAFVNNRSLGSRSVEWYESRIEKLRAQVAAEQTYVKKLRIMQQIKNAETAKVDAEDPTEEFIKVCLAYSELHGIEYDTWRELGVPAKTLMEAGWE